MRLNLFIAKSGFISRRKADILIKEGKVEVGGRKIYEPFFQVKDGIEVKIEGKSISLKEYVYILFNKPRGVTTTVYDKFARKTVIDFLPEKIFSRKTQVFGQSDCQYPRGAYFKKKGIYPVGRLDKDSCGLLILTNDGDLCYKLTHPKFSIEKEYLIILKGAVKPSDCKKAKRGIHQGGDHLKVADAVVLKQKENRSLCRVIVCEGKKRHLRRLFRGLGFGVDEIKRVRIGGVVLGRLESGKYKLIEKDKIYSKTLGKVKFQTSSSIT